MAELKKGILGPLHGKVGPVVGITLRGKHYVRTAPKKRHNWSPAQQQHRIFLSLVSKWLKQVKEVIEIGYQFLTKDRSAMNACVSDTMKNAVKQVDGIKEIDYPRVIFSRGELILSWILEILTLLDAVLRIRWDNHAISVLNKDSDKATVVVYNPEKEDLMSFEDVALRGDKEATINLPREFSGDTVHLWLHFVNQESDNVSTTSYLGQVLVV